MGPVGDQKEDRDCAVNFVLTEDGHLKPSEGCSFQGKNH